tara:strand:+ start:378 stop:623 length:246 start_codon:yes stop_codon:yes gene_type:complete
MTLNLLILRYDKKKRFMSKGFAADKKELHRKELKKKTLGSERMISWSPWPPANFQTKYPAFPLVMTIMLLFIGQIYISLGN